MRINKGPVRIDTWAPVPQVTPKKLRQSCDYYAKQMVKFDGLAEFHSYAEYLKGGLNEGNQEIETWVPQPFRFYFGREIYVPDAYIKYKDGRRVIEELKPRGEFDPDRKLILEQFCAFHEVMFEVVANETVLELELLAENWLLVTSVLASAKYINTENIEYSIIDRFINHNELSLGDFIDRGDAEGSYLIEIAVFRLCHRGKLMLHFQNSPLDYNTCITLQ